MRSTSEDTYLVPVCSVVQFEYWKLLPEGVANFIDPIGF